MSMAYHHTEWLSLVEISGPFLSLPVLQRIFPQGLEAHDPDHFKELRIAYGEWEASKNDPAIHNAWLNFILKESLEFPENLLAAGQAIPPGLEAQLAEFGEVIRPDLVILNPPGSAQSQKPRMLVHLLPPEQALEKSLSGSHWKVSPGTRMVELLHATEVSLGLVTNGEQWMLVFAPVGETSGFTTWYANLWLDEAITLRAFRSLLGVRRFFGVPDTDTLEAMLWESSQDQQEVTDQLGLQVRQAVEMLVQTLDRIDQDLHRTLLGEMNEKYLYEAALTLMMRLVFLFAAEERGMLLLGDPLYDQYYAISTLSAQLRETADQHGEEILERYHDAWCRLLATFRAVYGGVEHETMRLPAHDGNLFNPDRFPFLEGRQPGTSYKNTPAQPLQIDNRTVLHLLEALQFLQMKIPGGVIERRRLSFRALDIEQIGHVYEGLLDHTAVRAPVGQPVLGLVGSKNDEPEVSLVELEHLQAQGTQKLLTFLHEKTGRSIKALENKLQAALDDQVEQRLRLACGHDEDLYKRVQPYAGLLREDTFGRPLVILGGSVYVTEGTTRRESGTHYTPRALTEILVQHALEPLVFKGLADGKPKTEWQLRAAGELLQIRVCDPAMGSGAFLVQACRYLSERLVEAWESALKLLPEGVVGITPEGNPSLGSSLEAIIPADPDERLAYARRLICDRCLYGVDKNPMAVDMAKLSLWLITLDKGRAFTFLDHALKAGDSLLGLYQVEQMERFHINPFVPEAKQANLWWKNLIEQLLLQARTKRQELESFVVRDVQDCHRKIFLLQEADQAMAAARLVCDMLVGLAMDSTSTFSEKRTSFLQKLQENFELQGLPTSPEDLPTILVEATKLLNKGNPSGQPHRFPFHWPLEYPEVFFSTDDRKKGFSVLVSNPPFQGGQKITGILGTDYRNFLISNLAKGKKGSADLCAYFFLRAGQLLHPNGSIGMLATNTIAQGDTREVGLEQMVQTGFSIPRAVPSRKWPGSANLEVAHVWLRKGIWQSAYILNDRKVSGITPFLATPGKVTGTPYRLAANADKSFQGSIVLGMGFVLTFEEAEELIKQNPRNREVIFPYLNGVDLNSRPDQSPSRMVINFYDWPLDRSVIGSWDKADEKQRKKWLQEGRVPTDYPDPVAEDYPDVLVIVAERVKPERTRRKEDGSFVLRKPLPQRWWHYAEKRPALYQIIQPLREILVRSQVSEKHAMYFVSKGYVFDQKLVVFAFDNFNFFSIIQSSIHECWARKYSSTMRTDLSYAPSDCFETFPFPERVEQLDDIGERYYSHRQSIMASRQEGLTKTYNRFHNPDETSPDIVRLRELHAEMDYAVRDAYGWTDLDLQHGFYETKQGLRFTVSDEARQEILDRLLALNHERYAEEVKAGFHDKNKRKKVNESTKIPSKIKPIF